MEITPVPEGQIDLYKLNPSRLIQICSSNKKYAAICNDQKFIQKYERQHFTISRRLLERFSEKPSEFINWVHQYCSWYTLTREIQMNPCFMTIEKSSTTLYNNTGSGIIGCIANGIDIIKKALITDEGDKLSGLVYDQSNPTAEEILQILAPGLVIYMNQKIYEFPRCTLLYGLQDFIVYNELTEDPHFAFIFGMFYHLKYTLQITETIYFGDVNVVSFGFDPIERDDTQEQPFSYYPENFNEFKSMFEQYFNYVSINNTIKKFIIYLYEIDHEDIRLTGYLLTGENQAITDVFGTEFFKTFINNNYSLIDLTYDSMMNALQNVSNYNEMINWLAYNRQNYIDSYVDIVNAYVGDALEPVDNKYDRNKVYNIEGPTLVSELELLLLEHDEGSDEYIFIQLCIIMASLCGWNVMIRTNNFFNLEQGKNK